MACYGSANELVPGKPNLAERQSHLGGYLALRTRSGRFPMGTLPTHLYGSWTAIDHNNIVYIEFTVHVSHIHLLVRMPGSPD